MMLKVMEINSNEPRLTLKQICNQLSFSGSTVKRYRDDFSMDSPYKKINTERKTKNQILE